MPQAGSIGAAFVAIGQADPAALARMGLPHLWGGLGLAPFGAGLWSRSEAAQKGQREMNARDGWGNLLGGPFKTKASGRGHGSCFDPLPSIT